MEVSTLLGSAGVFLLLVAFFLNLVKIWTPNSKPYLIVNIAGSLMSCYASYLIGFMPFVVLEAIWTIVAAFGLATSFKRGS